MLTNANITIYNRKKINRSDVWVRTNITGVNLHGEAELIVGDKDLKAADKYIVRIPDSVVCDKTFVDSRTFKALSMDETDNCYTLQKGDVIVKGIIDDEITSPSQLQDRYDVLTILSITDNRRESSYTSHIKVVCG